MDKHSEDKRQSHKFNGATAGQLMESVLTLVPYDIRGAARVDLQTAIQLAILDDQEALPLDLEHEPADLAEAVEMLRRAKRALESAKAPSSLANNELEQRIVEMIRYIGVKAGIAETVYGAMCHEARCILSDYTSAATAMPDSPTPRTDDAKFKAGDTDADLEVVTAEFAGQLERGLADMTQARDAIRLLAQGWKEDAERAALSSANPINDAAPGVSAQGASDGQEGLMGDGPNPPSAAVAASPSFTPPTTTCNEPVAWAMYAIDTEELVCVNAIPPDDREGLRIEPLYLASSATPRADLERLHEWMLDHPYDAMLAFMEATNGDTFGVEVGKSIPASTMRDYLLARLPELMCSGQAVDMDKANG